jgi:hypothetical protein
MASMTVTSPTPTATAPREHPLLAALALLAAFAPSLVTGPFFGLWAWSAFADASTTVDLIWGFASAVVLFAPFVGALAAIALLRRRGTSWTNSVLAGAAVAFIAAGGGIALGGLAAAYGGM